MTPVHDVLNTDVRGVNNHGCCLNHIKLVFEVTINIQSGAKLALTTNPYFVCNINKPVCSQNRIFFGVLMLASGSRGNGTNFGWLKKSCDISTCNLSPNRNPEKYGRPIKSAIYIGCIRTRAHGRQVTSLLCLSDDIM